MQTRKRKNPGQKNTILFIKMVRGVRLISPNHLRIFFLFFQYVFNNFVFFIYHLSKPFSKISKSNLNKSVNNDHSIDTELHNSTQDI